MAEQFETVQGHLPVQQARWLRASAELRGRSVSHEPRSSDVECVPVLTAIKGVDGKPVGFHLQEDLEALSDKVLQLGDVGLSALNSIPT